MTGGLFQWAGVRACMTMERWRGQRKVVAILLYLSYSGLNQSQVTLEMDDEDNPYARRRVCEPLLWPWPKLEPVGQLLVTYGV